MSIHINFDDCCDECYRARCAKEEREAWLALSRKEKKKLKKEERRWRKILKRWDARRKRFLNSTDPEDLRIKEHIRQLNEATINCIGGNCNETK